MTSRLFVFKNLPRHTEYSIMCSLSVGRLWVTQGWPNLHSSLVHVVDGKSFVHVGRFDACTQYLNLVGRLEELPSHDLLTSWLQSWGCLPLLHEENVKPVTGQKKYHWISRLLDCLHTSWSNSRYPSYEIQIWEKFALLAPSTSFT